MAVSATTPIELVEAVYAKLGDRVALGRQRLLAALALARLFGSADPGRARPPQLLHLCPGLRMAPGGWRGDRRLSGRAAAAAARA